MTDQLIPRFPLPVDQQWAKWEACSRPEQRPDELTMFERGCRPCAIALRAAVTVEPPAEAFDGWWRTRVDSAPMVDAFMRAAGLEPLEATS